MFNGTYEKTCLIREKDDTFIPFETEEIICINPKSIKNFIDIVEQHKNIIIDGRLEYIILFGFLKYGLDLLIYDSYKLGVYSIIEYFASTMYIESTEISLNDIKKYCIGKLLIDYAFPHLKIRWNKDVAIMAIHERTLYNIKYDVVYMILRMMKPREYVKITSDKIERFYEIFDMILNIKDIEPATDINENELYSILCLIIDKKI